MKRPVDSWPIYSRWMMSGSLNRRCPRSWPTTPAWRCRPSRARSARTERVQTTAVGASSSRSSSRWRGDPGGQVSFTFWVFFWSEPGCVTTKRKLRHWFLSGHSYLNCLDGNNQWTVRRLHSFLSPSFSLVDKFGQINPKSCTLFKLSTLKFVAHFLNGWILVISSF